MTCANAGSIKSKQNIDQYKTLTELYNAGTVKAGVLLSHRKYGLLLVLSKENLIFAEPNICPFQSQFRFIEREIYEVLFWEVKKVRENVSEETLLMRAALGQRLINRSLPYHPVHCKLSHWWGYILKGATVKYTAKRSCPLRRR